MRQSGILPPSVKDTISVILLSSNTPLPTTNRYSPMFPLLSVVDVSGRVDDKGGVSVVWLST